MIKIGLMGCGTVADYGHLPAILQTSALRLEAVFDPNPARLAYVQRKFNIPRVFSDPAEFFRSGIEAVTITSPAPCHLENVLQAAEFGKPVLCEKPLAMNEAESERMIAAMNRARLPLYLGFTYRFSPAAIQIRKLVAERAVGEVRDLRLYYIWNCHGKLDHEDKSKPNQRRVLRMLEGGPMVDCGTHQIDLARWWLNSEVVAFHGHGAWVEDYEAPDHMYLHMDHANRAHTMVEISYSYDHVAKEPLHRFGYELIGTEGTIRYDREGKLFEVRTAEGTRPLPWAGEKNFEELYAEFARALKSGQSEMLASAQDGLIVTRIARQATEQAIARRERPGK